MERLVTFKVLDQEFPLYTDAPEKDVQEILFLVKTQLESIGQASQHILPANKLAILASLNIASNFVKIKKEYEGVKITYEMGEPEAKEVDGMLIIVQNDKQHIDVSDETLNRIITSIEEVRHKIISM